MFRLGIRPEVARDTENQKLRGAPKFAVQYKFSVLIHPVPTNKPSPAHQAG